MTSAHREDFGRPARGEDPQRASALHVAALPFPSPQGTQAAIDAMLRAELLLGHAPRLLTYPDGTTTPSRTPYPHHRSPDLPGETSLRSGPSLRKLALDVGLYVRTRQCVSRYRPDVVIAHHVEAAACAVGLGLPTIFFAHTDLGAELPAYFDARFSEPLGHVGHAIDGLLLQAHRAVACVSPLLRDQLRARHPGTRAAIEYVPIPWAPAMGVRMPRRAARHALGLPHAVDLLLYAGNLDAYQGLDVLLEALSRLPSRRRELHVLIASESDPTAFLRAATEAGVAAHVHHRPLDDERARALVHAAADFAVITRRVPGGVPIKLLDALARGLAAIATPRACAGLPLGGAVLQAAGDDAPSLAAAIDAARTTRAIGDVLSRAGRSYLQRHHTPFCYAEALDRIVPRRDPNGRSVRFSREIVARSHG